MNYKDGITTIFCKADDFYKEFSQEIAQIKQLSLCDGKKHRNRTGPLCDSEIITIFIGFHWGAHKTLKDYNKQIVQGYCRDLFPNAVSYNRFIELQQRVFCSICPVFKAKYGHMHRD